MEERLSLAPFRNILCPGWIDIHNTDQFHPLHLGILFCMELAQVSDTNHAYPDLTHLTADPPLRMLDELEKMLNLWRLRDFVFFHLLHRLLQCQTGAKNNTVSLL